MHLSRRYIDCRPRCDGVLGVPGGHDAPSFGNIEYLFVGVRVEVQPGSRAEGDQQHAEASRLFGVNQRLHVHRPLADDFVLGLNGFHRIAVYYYHASPL